MELECPVGLREICVHFNEGSLGQLGRSVNTKYGATW